MGFVGSFFGMPSKRWVVVGGRAVSGQVWAAIGKKAEGSRSRRARRSAPHHCVPNQGSAAPSTVEIYSTPSASREVERMSKASASSGCAA
jgi:hypothetical protein